jgi:hypothetical protein
LVVALAGDLQLRLDVLEGGFFEGGVEVLGSLLAGGLLTDIIEIH